VYQSRVHYVDLLKQRLMDVWHGMEQSVINLLAVQLTNGAYDLEHSLCAAKGAHLEHKRDIATGSQWIMWIKLQPTT